MRADVDLRTFGGGMANPFITDARIEEEVRKALAATLRVDADAIDLDASIVKELGATSIDFLDVNFRLEAAFGIQLATQLMLDHVEEEMGEGTAIDDDDKITEAAAALLRTHLGDLEALKAGTYADKIPSLVTPMVLVKSVRVITDELPEKCTSCGAEAWKSEDGAQVICGACGKPAEYPDGDTMTKRWIHAFEEEHHLFAGG
jgi:acyl carrier protein